MRLSVIIGVLAALVIGAVVIGTFLSTLRDQPVAAPTPGAPSAPPVETASPVAVATPTDVASPTPSSTDDGSSPGMFTQPPEGVAVGQRAPRIRLEGLDGGQLDTRDYRGRPLWVNFMATWCPQCREELPMMETLQTQLEEELAVVIVDVGEEREVVEDFMSSINVDLPTGLDESRATQQEWGAYALPIHYWIDEGGVIRAVLFGGAPRELFIESLRTVVPEAEIE